MPCVIASDGRLDRLLDDVRRGLQRRARIPEDVEVADQRHDEGERACAVGCEAGEGVDHRAVQDRHEAAAADRHAHQTRRRRGGCGRSLQRQREDRREHDRVHQAEQQRRDRGDEAHGQRRDIATGQCDRAAERRRRHVIGRDDDEAQDRCARTDQRQQRRRLGIAQQHAAAEAADHREQHEQRRDIAGDLRRHVEDVALFEEEDHARNHADLGADVQEDGNRAEVRPARAQRRQRRFDVGRKRGRMCVDRALGEEDEAGEDREDHRDHQIDVGDEAEAVRLQRRRQHRILGEQVAAQQIGCAKCAADIGAERVERLAEVEAEVRALRIAHRRDQRVGRDLQQGDARRGDEQPEQHGDEAVRPCGRPGDETAGDDAQQAEDDRIGVAAARQIPGRRNRHDAISDEEGELVELRFEVAERVDDLHALHERVDQVRHERPDEEQRRHIDERKRDARLASARHAAACGRGRWCHHRSSHVLSPICIATTGCLAPRLFV
ncbi:hypothetical protein WR25_20063 [Diploscapter pachys]|uniref:Uncharacterized protein n=1 Tax=Diploscapter pachys TaxID=2018661 RepID=A0A2A2KDT9_9BILA|nr:hypothetical protein WR25_20063 [Diploscapter pachys]